MRMSEIRCRSARIKGVGLLLSLVQHCNRSYPTTYSTYCTELYRELNDKKCEHVCDVTTADPGRHTFMLTRFQSQEQRNINT